MIDRTDGEVRRIYAREKWRRTVLFICAVAGRRRVWSEELRERIRRSSVEPPWLADPAVFVVAGGRDVVCGGSFDDDVAGRTGEFHAVLARRSTGVER